MPLSDGKDPVLDGKDPVLDKNDHVCAAEAIFCCPTENSHHLEAKVLSKNAPFHNEKESTRTLARCQVSLEKSSKNYSRCENEPSQATCIVSPLPHPPVKRRVLVACFPCGGAKHAKKRRQKYA